MTGQHLMFVRHGETVGNIERIAHGQSESPLNHRGIQQAEFTAKLLIDWERSYHRIYASPMSRAQDTARAISSATGLPIHTHENLKEGYLGDWEGITYQQLAEFEFAKKSILDDDFDGHNGESPNQLAKRMSSAVYDIRNRHPEENIIIVSHGAAISHGMSVLLDTKPAFGHKYLMHNSAVTELIMHPDPEILTLNYHEHIPNELKVDPTGDKES